MWQSPRRQRVAMDRERMEAGEIEAICERIPELNRTSLGVVLRSLFDFVRVSPSEEEMKFFGFFRGMHAQS